MGRKKEKIIKNRKSIKKSQQEAMKHTVKMEVKEPTTEEKYVALNEKYIRLLAEYDNYRKRKDR